LGLPWVQEGYIYPFPTFAQCWNDLPNASKISARTAVPAVFCLLSPVYKQVMTIPAGGLPSIHHLFSCAERNVKGAGAPIHMENKWSLADCKKMQTW
jgi:hypothetical protein